MLNRTLPPSSESPTQWIRVFLAKDATDIIVEYVYRGDDRLPQQIFSEGFTSRGVNKDLLSHVNPCGDWLEDSGYVSTSTSKEAAKKFPHHLRGRGFLYEVNLHPKAIDVPTVLTPEVGKGALHFEDFETFHAEKERAFPLKIDKKDIKGAWPFDVLGEAGEFEKGRIVHKEYIPNPDYKVPVLAKVAGITKIAGKAASVVGTAIDGTLLYETYKKSQTSGNYAPFFESATSIIGGWGGSITLGSQFGSVGAQIGGVMGPAGVVVGGVAGSLVGSILGSTVGEKLAHEVMNRGTKLHTAVKSFDRSSESHIPHQLYFDPLKNQENGGRTFVEDLGLRVLTQPSSPFTPDVTRQKAQTPLERHMPSSPAQTNAQDKTDLIKATSSNKPMENTAPKSSTSTPLHKKEALAVDEHDTITEERKGTLLASGALGAMFSFGGISWLTANPVIIVATTVAGALVSGTVVRDNLSPQSEKPSLDSSTVAPIPSSEPMKSDATPSAFQATALPKSGLYHQSFVDPRGCDIGSGSMFDDFEDERDVLFSKDDTQALLEKTFQKKQVPAAVAKQKAETLTNKINDHFSQQINTDRADPAHQASKKALLDEIKTEADEPTWESMKASMQGYGDTIEKAKVFYHDYETKRVEAFQQTVMDLNALCFARGEIEGVGKTFEFLGVLGQLHQAPHFVKAAQVGQGLVKVAERVNDILVSKAKEKISDIGTMAATGNWFGLLTSVASLMLPFLSMNQGPTQEEIIFDYLQNMLKHLDSRLDTIDQTQKYIRQDIQYLIELAKAHFELTKRLGQQLYDFQHAILLPLDKIIALLQSLHVLVKRGLDEVLFKDFRATLSKLDEALKEARPDLKDVLPTLLEDLAHRDILGSSQSEFSNGACLFKLEMIQGHLPTDRVFFSAEDSIDTSVLIDSEAYKQAVQIAQFHDTANAESLLGFYAVYAATLLADERASLQDIQAEITKKTKELKEITTQKQELENSLAVYSPAANNDVEKVAHAGQVTKLFGLYHQEKQLENRLSTLLKLQVLKKPVEAAQKRTELQTEQTMRKFNRQHTRLSQERENFIQHNMTAQHPKRQAIEMRLRVLEQKRQHLPFHARIQQAYTKPSYQVVAPPLWLLGIEGYVKGLEHPSLDAHYHETHQSTLHKIIISGTETLAFIGDIQKQPNLFKKLWRSYAEAVVGVHRRYNDNYAVHRQSISEEVKAQYLRDSKLNPQHCRVGEQDYVKKLLDSELTLGSDFKRSLLMVQTRKKLLIQFCELVGAPKDVLDALRALPCQKDIRTELEEQVLKIKEPAPFTQPGLYERLNQAASLLSKTLFNPEYTLPAPETTAIGAPIAAYLARLHQMVVPQQLKTLVEQMEKQDFTIPSTGAHKAESRPSESSTILEIDSDEAFDRTPYESLLQWQVAPEAGETIEAEVFYDMDEAPPDENSIETLAKTILLGANMGCQRDAKNVLVLGMSGSETAFISSGIGCELERKPNPNVINAFNKEVVAIKSCPDTLKRHPVINHQGSQTAMPEAYVQSSPAPLTLAEISGSPNNQGDVVRLRNLIGTNVAIHTMETIQALVLMVPYEHLLGKRLTSLERTIRLALGMFTQDIEPYLPSLNLVLTRFPKTNSPSKADLISVLQVLARDAHQSSIKTGSMDDRNYARWLSFLASDAGSPHLFLFDPDNTPAVVAWLETLKQFPSFPSADIALVGETEVKKELTARFDKAVEKRQPVLEKIIESPKKIKALQRKKAYLEQWLKNHPPAQGTAGTANAKPTPAEVEMQQQIDQITVKINSIKKTETALETAQQKLTTDTQALTKRENLSPVRTFEWNELAIYGDKNSDYHTPWYSNWYANTPPATRSAILARHSPPSIVRTHVSVPWTGIYTSIKVEFKTIDCWLEGPKGQLNITEVPTGKEGAKTVTISYDSPGRCVGYYKVHCMHPYNAIPTSTAQLKIWATAFEKNQRSLIHEQARKKALEATKSNLEKQLTKNKQDKLAKTSPMSSKIAAKQAELRQTKTALITERTAAKSAETRFSREQGHFENLDALYGVIHMDTVLGQRFHNNLVAVLTQLNRTNTVNIERCAKKEGGPTEGTTPSFFRAAEKPKAPKTFFGIPGVEADSTTRYAYVNNAQSVPQSPWLTWLNEGMPSLSDGLLDGVVTGCGTVVTQQVNARFFKTASKEDKQTVQMVIRGLFYFAFRAMQLSAMQPETNYLSVCRTAALETAGMLGGYSLFSTVQDVTKQYIPSEPCQKLILSAYLLSAIAFRAWQQGAQVLFFMAGSYIAQHEVEAYGRLLGSDTPQTTERTNYRY